MDVLDEEFMIQTAIPRDKFRIRGKNKDHIIAFEANNMLFVREYEKTSTEYYRCIECHRKNHEVKARICKIDNGQEIFKIFNAFSHTCSFKRYDSVQAAIESRTIPKKAVKRDANPTENTPEKKVSKLISNSPKLTDIMEDRSINKKSKSEGPQRFAISAGTRTVLKSKSRITIDLKTTRLVNPEDYIYGVNTKGTPNSRLIIKEENDKEKARHYRFVYQFTYECIGCDVFKQLNKDCKEIKAKARIVKDESGQELIYVDKKHLCKPKNFKDLMEIQNAADENGCPRIKGKSALDINTARLVNPEDYIFDVNSKGTPNSRLIIKEENDKEKARHYRFVYQFTYVCNGCYYLKRSNKDCKETTAKARIVKDESGQELIYVDKKHLCKPKNFKDLMEIQNAADENGCPRINSALGINTARLVNPEDYEFGVNTKGTPNSRLIIKEENDKEKARQYNFKTKVTYVCSGCDVFKRSNKDCKETKAKARIVKDESGQELIYVDKKHLCKPKNFKDLMKIQNTVDENGCIRMNTALDINTARLVNPEDYEFGVNTKKIPKSRLIIREEDNKEKARGFSQMGDSATYICIGCKTYKVHHPNCRKTPAKAYLVDTLVYVQKGHLCKPKSYEMIMKEQNDIIMKKSNK